MSQLEALFEMPDNLVPTQPTRKTRSPNSTRKSAPVAGVLDGGADYRVQTQGIKYAGSKLKLIPNILDSIKHLDVKTVLDGFSGTTRVSQALAKNGYRVVANDIADWSSCFGTAYLLNTKHPDDYVELIEHLNNVSPVDGWFTETYGGHDYEGSSVQPDGRKKLWQVHNTRKLDGIRNEIDRLELDEVTKSVALTSLILALDKVDSTMGHFVSYLRDWAPRSYLDLRLAVPMIWPNQEGHLVTQRDVLGPSGPSDEPVDLAYFDPPYGSNNEKMPPSRVRYQSYYHVWTTVVRNDQPEVFGAAARRADSSDQVAGSVFEDFRRNEQTNHFVAIEALDKLLATTPAHYIALSYSSDGRATAEDLDGVLQSHGKLISTAVIDYKRNVMAGMRWTNQWLPEVASKNQEFIFLIEK